MKKFKRKFICWWIGCTDWKKPGVCERCGKGWQFRWGTVKWGEYHFFEILREWFKYLFS